MNNEQWTRTVKIINESDERTLETQLEHLTGLEKLSFVTLSNYLSSL